MKPPLIVLTGPTAVGKTALSISLAKALNAEIVSADSMQVYRQMNIGSAKVHREEMEGIPHHLIDCYDPDEEFNVVEFQRAAREAIRGIFARGRIPIVAGGTGFYIQALLRDIHFTEAGEDTAYRNQLMDLAEREGPEALHRLLAETDPASAAVIHPHNVRRTIRALEYHRQTGRRISDHNEEERKRESPYHYAYFVLTRPRDELYRRIDERVDGMMSEGLLEEVAHLRERGYHRGLVSMQGLGYKELLAYLEGECTLEEAVFRIKRDTRHFAKRQLTWFRRESDVIWLDRSEHPDDGELTMYIQKILTTMGIAL